jgi:23S rRNA (uracil1939-C5)-methyltransferase
MNSSFTLTLAKLTYGGDALGRLEDGRAVFVPFGLPGETVRARIVEEKRGHARAELVEVLEASPERIAPKCKYFFSPLSAAEGGGEGQGVGCGGCHYQHMPYAAQLSAKESILRDQLTRLGRIENPPVRPIVPSPAEWNYRNHMQFHLTAEGRLGFISPPPSGEGPGRCPEPVEGVRAISECHLPTPPLAAIWPQLAFDPGLGLERVSLRLGAGEETMLILESDDPHPPELEIEADISAVHLYRDHAAVLAGDDHIFINVLERPFRVSAASFFQVNTAMAAQMVEHLLDHLPLSPADTLLDVYCGVGLFSAFFAPRVGRVIGVEASPSACEDFAANLDEFENVELYEGAAEENLPGLVAQIGNLRLAIVDPPRAGLGKRVMDALLALRPRTLAYVSCDPSTLARDAARLIAGGYMLKQATPFDLFPQTFHIESLSIFELQDKPAGLPYSD